MRQPEELASENVLETEHLLLRRFEVSDASVLRELWLERDPRVPPHRQVSADGHPTLEELEISIGRTDSPMRGLLAAERKDSPGMIGYCGLLANSHGDADEPELAYEFLQSTWNRGYATEAGQAVVEWAGQSGYHRLWATIRDWNTASRRVAIKLGFFETDRVDADERYGDSLYYRKDL